MPSGEDDPANETSGEERLIGRYFRPLATTPGAFALGDAALGVLLHRDAGLAERWQLSAGSRTHLRDRYLLPQPRNVLAEALRHNASAAMDVSDGLVGDLAKLCRASGVAAEIDVASVPLSDAARGALSADAKLVESILTGGDDYEILATLPPAKLGDVSTPAAEAGV